MNELHVLVSCMLMNELHVLVHVDTLPALFTQRNPWECDQLNPDRCSGSHCASVHRKGPTGKLKDCIVLVHSMKQDGRESSLQRRTISRGAKPHPLVASGMTWDGEK